MRSVTKHDDHGRIVSHNQYRGKNLVESVKYEYIGQKKKVSYFKYCKIIKEEYYVNDML